MPDLLPKIDVYNSDFKYKIKYKKYNEAFLSFTQVCINKQVHQLKHK